MKSNAITVDQEAELILNEDGQITPIITEAERTITNRLGYKIQVKDAHGEWLEDVVIVDDNGSATHLHNLPAITHTRDTELNAVLESMVNRIISSYLPTTTRNYIDALFIFTQEHKDYGLSIDRTIEKTMSKAASNKYYSNPSAETIVRVLKQLTVHLVAHEYPGLSIDRAEELVGASLNGNRNNYMKLFLMDDSFGPFTREEMGIIQAALDDDDLDIPLDSRIIVQLCVDWGLRPIQLSLLKEKDFQHNPQNGSYWLNVPRVKQKQHDRRTQFKKRLISERLGLLITKMMEQNQWKKTYYGIDDPPLFHRRFERMMSDKSGIINVNDRPMLNPHIHKYEGAKYDYAFHIHQYIILRRIHEVECFLPLSPRTGQLFNLTPYRFRYTLGTASVTQGMSAPEVAERLDHSNAESVRHYFKNTEHLWEVIQEATTSRIEQGHFVAKFMSKEPESDNIYAVDITERTTLTTIGKCHKGTACQLEPAVACYSCSSFKPNENVEGHQKAKSVIVELMSRAQSQSSKGEIQHVFDEALVGVEAAIAYAQDDQSVLGINDSEPNELPKANLGLTHILEMTDE